MSNPTIAIYVSSATDDHQPDFSDNYYKEAYEDLFINLIQKGARVVCTFDADTNYIGQGFFNQCWEPILQNEKISYSKISTPTKVDLVYNKNTDRFQPNDIVKINPDLVMKITSDKYLSYLFSSDFHAKCYLISNAEQLNAISLLFKDKYMALKELDSNGGKKVFVGALSNYLGDLEYPILAQEFIDTSGGTPDGMADGVHDIRVRLFNGNLLGGSLRYPAEKDELRSNLALGGNVRGLFVKDLPSELIDKTLIIDKRFNINSPRFFSADWGFDKISGEWKLFELNNSPGLANIGVDGPAAGEFIDLLADNLIESAR